MTTTSESDKAWAAGLFEGEGSFGYQPNHVRMELAMTDHPIVHHFHEVVGVGRITSRKTYSERHTPQIVWRVTDREGVMKVLSMLWPWLGKRRRERGVEILAIQHEKAKRPLRVFVPGEQLRATMRQVLDD